MPHKQFYVSQIRDGRGWRLLAGPLATREEAEAQVRPARERVCRVDPWSDFDSFGVCTISKDLKYKEYSIYSAESFTDIADSRPK